MKKVVTIGGGNGHSNMLKGIRKVFLKDIELTSIVSMSDDGRTTGMLMKIFEKEKNTYFPPPWDLRKCLYSLSKSEFAHIFEILLESKFRCDFAIGKLTTLEYFEFVIKEILESQDSIFWEDEAMVRDFLKKKGLFYEYLVKKLWKLSDVKLKLQAPLSGHKLWNIFMANLATHFSSFQQMMDCMHDLLKVKAKILPITTQKAIIKAKTDSGEVIETQEAISDIADYSGKIISLELCDNSKTATCDDVIKTPIMEADYIIIAPGDLYTSTIANFIIGGVKPLIQKSKAKLIFVANNTNKWGETFGYTLRDFVDEIHKYLGRTIDYLVVNKKRVQLSFWELEKLKSNISVQWGDYIFLTSDEKGYFTKKNIKVIEENLIDTDSLYKHDRKNLWNVLKKIII